MKMSINFAEIMLSALNILLLLGSIGVVAIILYLVYKGMGNQKKIKELEQRIDDLEKGKKSRP